MALARAGNATEANNRRQLSTTERIAATFGPACGLPRCIQFFLVSKYFDTRNYVHSRIMCTPEGKKCMIPEIDGPFSQETLPCRCA